MIDGLGDVARGVQQENTPIEQRKFLSYHRARMVYQIEMPTFHPIGALKVSAPTGMFQEVVHSIQP